MKKIIEQAVKFLIYCTFFVPLVLIPSSFIFPFVVPKILLLRSLITAMSAGYILLLIINWREYRPRFTALNLVLLAFLFSFAISTFVGVDAYHSFWDNHERMLGLFTIFHYVAYYFICSAIFKNWTDWKLALRIFLLAGSVVMFLGVLQKFNPDFLLNQGSDRVSSTLGNSIYVGGYGLFLFFSALLLFLKEKNNVWRLLEGLLGALGILGMILSGTRGSLLGFLVGLSAVLIGYVIISKDYPRTRMAFGGALGVMLIILGLLYLNRQSVSVQNIPVLGRLLNSSLSGGTGNTRLIAWNIAIESWKARPIFGWGPNNFFYAFNQHYNPRSLEFGYGETWFDNAHNIILNTLSVQGLFGLLVYLSIFAIAILSLWQAKNTRQKNLHLVVIGSAFLIAHLIQNITVFENPTSYLYFMFWLALANRFSVGYSPDLPGEKEVVVTQGKTTQLNPDKQIGAGLVGFVGAVAFLIIFIFNIQPARANMKTLAALEDFSRDPLNVGIVSVKEALAFNSPHIDDIRSDLSRTIMQVMGNIYQKISPAQGNDILALAEGALEENIKLHPLDIRIYLTLAQLNQLEYVVNKDPRYLPIAEQYLETALRYSPKRQQLAYMLSSMKAQLNKKDEAISLLEQVITDDPRVGESYWRLAYTYNMFGDVKSAKAAIALAKSRGVAFDAQGDQVAAMIMSATTPKANGTKR